MPVGVRGSDECREFRKRQGLKPKLLDNRVERASLAAMTPEHTFDIKWGSVEALRDRLHFRGRDKEYDGSRIDEAANEPRTSDAIDFRPRACYPHRSPLRIASGQFAFRDERETRLRPSRMSAGKNLGGRGAAVTQPRGNAFALGPAVLAYRHCRASGEFRRPGRHCSVRPAYRAGNEARIGGEGIHAAHVDERGSIRHADQAPKRIRRYAVELRHSAPSNKSGAILRLSPHGEIAPHVADHNLRLIGRSSMRLELVKWASWIAKIGSARDVSALYLLGSIAVSLGGPRRLSTVCRYRRDR